jgi:hypothetical protein
LTGGIQLRELLVVLRVVSQAVKQGLLGSAGKRHARHRAASCQLFNCWGRLEARKFYNTNANIKSLSEKMLNELNVQ